MPGGCIRSTGSWSPWQPISTTAVILFGPQVWNDAGTQVFYSYAVALGGMIALGSYNKFNNNFFKQCGILCVCNSATSLFAGFGIFSILGYMSYQLELPMDQVAEAGVCVCV